MRAVIKHWWERPFCEAVQCWFCWNCVSSCRLPPPLLPWLQHHPRPEGALPHVADGGAAAAAGGATGGRLRALHHHQTLRLLPVRHQRHHVRRTLGPANQGAAENSISTHSFWFPRISWSNFTWSGICSAAFTGSWESTALRGASLTSASSWLDKNQLIWIFS